jgi:hypothetical protein
VTVFVVKANCWDYYCGCGLGHLLGIALTAEDAERLRAEGAAASREFESVAVEEVQVNVFLHEAVR